VSEKPGRGITVRLVAPLRARVAQALGCAPRLFGGEWICECLDRQHACDGVDGAPREGESIESYDTDWSATGPLIEKYRVQVTPCVYVHGPGGEGGCDHKWTAVNLNTDDEASIGEGVGETPLIAICNLLLSLAEVGKLA
jgi:hypothetical protein